MVWSNILNQNQTIVTLRTVLRRGDGIVPPKDASAQRVRPAKVVAILVRVRFKELVSRMVSRVVSVSVMMVKMEYFVKIVNVTMIVMGMVSV